ncbi:MAG: hypothetical protein ACUVV0_12945 [Anaerolineae bacterium]
METNAHLVNPQGETISLTPEDYEAILELLAKRQAQHQITTENLKELIAELCGKYASDSSLTEALLRERQTERLA